MTPQEVAELSRLLDEALALEPGRREPWLAQCLQQALAAGELARAPSFGKPLPSNAAWDETPEALRKPFKILKDAGIAPPEIALRLEALRRNAQL